MSNKKLLISNEINFNKLCKTSSNFKNELNGSNHEYFPNRTSSFSKFNKISSKINLENLNEMDSAEYKQQSKLSLRFNRLKDSVKLIHEKNRNQESISDSKISYENQNIFSFTKLEMANPLRIHTRRNSKSCSFTSDFLKTTSDKINMKSGSSKSKKFHFNTKRDEILNKIDNIIGSKVISDSNLNPAKGKEKKHRLMVKTSKNLHYKDINNIKHHSFDIDSPRKLIGPLTNNFLNHKDISPKKSADFNYSYNNHILRHFSTKNSVTRFSLHKPKISFCPEFIKIKNEEKKEGQDDDLKYDFSEKKSFSSSNWRKLNLTKDSFRHTHNNPEYRQQFDLLFATEYNNILHKIESTKKSIANFNI